MNVLELHLIYSSQSISKCVKHKKQIINRNFCEACQIVNTFSMNLYLCKPFNTKDTNWIKYKE